MTGTAPTRLLVLTSSFPRWAGDTDPRFVEELSFELAREFDVTVLAPRCPGADRHERLVRDGRSIDVERFRYFFAAFESLAYDGGIMAKVRRNPLRALLVPLFLVGQLLALRRLQREKRFAIVHEHWVIPQGIVAALFGRLDRSAPPFLITAHGSDLASLKGPIASRIKRHVLARAAGVSVVSEALRAEAEALDCEPGEVVVAPMGVDLQSTFTPGNAVDRRGIIYVGKLAAYKGAGTLIEAMAQVAKSHPDATLTIVGDGDERESLQRRTSEPDLAGRVAFRGALPQSQLPGLLRAAQVAVVPSLREGLGLVIVEALGCGCAVVASDLPAVRDVIADGRTGLLARPGDAADLAEKIGTLLGDAGMRQTLAEAGRAHAVARFDWQPVGARYAELLREHAATPGS